MSARDFCWQCGARILTRPIGRGQAKCEEGHKIDADLICTREQYRQVAEMRAELLIADHVTSAPLRPAPVEDFPLEIIAPAAPPETAAPPSRGSRRGCAA